MAKKLSKYDKKKNRFSYTKQFLRFKPTPEDVEKFIIYPVKILERNGFVVTFKWNSGDVRSYDFSKDFESWKKSKIWSPLLNEDVFSCIMIRPRYIQNAGIIWPKVMDAPITDPDDFVNEVPVPPYKCQIYRPHFFAEYHGFEFAEETDYICTFDEWAKAHYGKGKPKRIKNWGITKSDIPELAKRHNILESDLNRYFGF